MEETANVESTLIELNEGILEEYILRNNTEPLQATALESYIVMTPGGLETKEQAIAGVSNVDADKVRVENEQCQIHGTTAILAGTLSGTRTIAGRPVPDIGYLSVYVKNDGEWRLAARSLTPQGIPP